MKKSELPQTNHYLSPGQGGGRWITWFLGGMEGGSFCSSPSIHPFIHLFVFLPIKNEQTLMPTYPTGCKGVVRSGNACSSRGWFTIIFVATVIKSVPTVLDTKGKEREARRLHSITWQTGIGKYIKQVTFWYHWQPRILDTPGVGVTQRGTKSAQIVLNHMTASHFPRVAFVQITCSSVRKISNVSH